MRVGPSNLVELLLGGREHGDKTCLAYVGAGGSDVEEEISYAHFVDRAQRVAGGLRGIGVGPGSHVALVAAPRIDYMVSMAAALMAGGVLVPVNHLFKRRELHAYLRTGRADAVIVDADTAGLVADVAQGLEGVKHLVSIQQGVDVEAVSVDELARSEPCVPVRPERDVVAVLMHTSGTTGLPKAVPRTHATYNDFALTWARNYMRPTDRIFSFMPMYHQAGFVVQWLPAFSLGLPFYQLERFSPGPFWETIRRYRLTSGLFMPPVPHYLLLQPESPGDRDHPVEWAYGLAPPDQWLAFQERFGVPLHGGYGSTETTIVGMSGSRDDPPYPKEKLDLPLGGSVMGQPVPDWCSMRIADEAGRECSPLELGECQFKGPGVLTEYYENPQATATAFTEDGWFRSGDIGYRTADGRFIMVDRTRNLIRRSGENIAPGEIEEVLMDHPEIAEAAVVPVPDEHRGQEIRACVVRTPGSELKAEDIFAYCERELANFKVPRYIDFREELPHTPTLKVRKEELMASGDPPMWEDRAKRSGQSRT